MTAVTLGFAVLGMLSPASRGGLTSVAIVSYLLVGLFAGFYGGRIYKLVTAKQVQVQDLVRGRL